ncbi:hypothetical protein [Oscillibacter sp. PC13]|uniref:hypothetical protein n=1 Tax=Oscillibacter sp. PC13 TaxID=1855299 RepID=UPI000B80FEF6|nr:hypothetical protein [Oscillibacter sp. PC13]
MKYITDNICALTYSKGGAANGEGWSCALRWYGGNGETIENITLSGNRVIISSGYYYKITLADDKIDLVFLEGRFAKYLELPDIESADVNENAPEVLETTEQG